MLKSTLSLLCLWHFCKCAAGVEDAGHCEEQSGSSHADALLQRAHERSHARVKLNQSSKYVAGTPGAAWTEEEALIVMGKLHRVFTAQQKVYEELESINGKIDCHTGFAPESGEGFAEECDGQDGRETGEPAGESLPDAAKFVRLGFHDCFKYKDGSGGCDGCLRFYDMFHKYNDLASGDKRQMRRGDPVSGTNNGLYLAADVLDLIYTKPDFPGNTHPLPESLEASGKSRADLWAFAALVATDYAMMENNHGCTQNEPCNHLYNELGIECEINVGRNLVFTTGRMDCAEESKATPESDGYVHTQPFELAKGHKYRNYETTKDEDTPNPSGNSSMITDYMARVFGFSKKETVAIMGAHSLGEMHGINGLWKYTWQWQQTKFLNNNYYRMLVSKPSYFMMCEKDWGSPRLPFRRAGGPNGRPAKTGWFVRPIRKSVSGGPYEWFHWYNRCPLCYKRRGGGWVSDEPRGDESYQSNKCCECNEQEPEDVDPACWTEDTKVTKDECMLPTDMAMYISFDSDPKTGFPSGCPGMSPPESWNHDNIVNVAKNGWQAGVPVEFYSTEPLCPKTQLNDGKGTKSMSELVEEYADNQNGWAKDFYDAWEKMLSNGYAELTPGPDVLGIGRANCRMLKRKMTCTL